MISTADLPLIEERLGGVTPLNRSTSLNGSSEAQPDPLAVEADPLVEVLRLLGRISGDLRQTTMGWAFDIECPWSHEHTDRALEGAVYVPIHQRFRCLHGHCDERHTSDMRQRLDELLREDSAGLDCLARYEFDDIAPAAAITPGRPLSAYEMTEAGAARAFADRYETRLRFDHARGCWFCWTGNFWREDTVQQAFRRTLGLAHEFGQAMRDATPAQLRTIGKVAFAQAIERATRADKRLATDGLSWDGDPWLAGVPGGVIDLRTGKLLPPDPSQLITRQLSVVPSDMPTPIWDRFLWDSTSGDPELIDFLYAWVGYCLTGDISEEVFVFLYGPGGNGKGVFLLTIASILNDYAARVPADMFMVRKFEAHPEEVARLAGVRAVFASEIEEGRTFNAGRLKDFSGRDGKLTGRFMRQNTFEFMPQFKLTLVGNNRPKLVSVDRAIERRTILVPFTQKPRVPDGALKDRLVAEHPGILRKMIEGELRRRACGGLSALLPRAATEATSEYLDDQDTLGAWATERCVFGPGEQVGAKLAFEDYRLWCHSRGEFTEITIQDFSRKFVEKFPECRRNPGTKRGTRLEGVSLSNTTG